MIEEILETNLLWGCLTQVKKGVNHDIGKK